MNIPRPDDIVVSEYEHQKAEIIRLLKETNGNAEYPKPIDPALLAEFKAAGWTHVRRLTMDGDQGAYIFAARK